MKKIHYWVFGLILMVLSLLFEDSFRDFFINLRISSLNGLISYFSWLTSGLFTLIFIGIFISIWKRKLIFRYLIGFGFTGVVVYGLKELIGRLRPIDNIINASGFSFPSGHAASAFFALGFIWGDFKKFKWFWLVFSLLIIFARLYVGAHYFSDVALGVLIGLFFGNLFRKKKLSGLV